MDYRSTRTLCAYAAGIQAIAIAITYLLYVNQEMVKAVFSGAQEIFEIRSVPVAYFIASICPAFLYFLYMEFQMFAQEKGRGKKAGTITFFVFACLMEIVLGFAPRVETMLIGKRGVSALASYSVLTSAISTCIRPFSVIAFGLFALSAGGNLFMPEEPKAGDDLEHYYSEWGNQT